VDEKGTEAAAATIVIMMAGAIMPEGVVLTIDRPFIYFVRDVPTGTILFMGRVVDPR
jgi:serpin B